MTDPVDQKLSDLPLVTPAGSDLLYAVHSAASSKATISAVAALLFTATGPTGVNGFSSVVTGPTGSPGSNSVTTGPTGVNGAAVGPTGPNGSSMSFHQASPTPSLAVPINGEITVTHPADGNAISVAKINTSAPTPAPSVVFKTSYPISRRFSGGASVILPSGKILVVGGGSYSKQCYIYDPIANNWTATADTDKGHKAHTATLLNNGLVLVAGGDSSTSQTTELFDPAGNGGVGTWTIGPALTYRHSRHGAFLLPSGKVLITAGGYNWGVDTNCELYNPTTNLIEATGSQINPHYYASDSADHFAGVLLPTGKVLLAGDLINNTDIGTNTAEIYDPAGNGGVGSWTATGNMSIIRWRSTIILLPSGKVLAAGGLDGSLNELSSCEIWDPAGNGGVGSWSASTPLPITAQTGGGTNSTLVSGHVLVVLGCTSGGFSALCKIYDPIADTWTATLSLNTARFDFARAFYNNKLLIIGGYNGSEIASCELIDVEPLTIPPQYDPATIGKGVSVPETRFPTAEMTNDTTPAPYVASLNNTGSGGATTAYQLFTTAGGDTVWAPDATLPAEITMDMGASNSKIITKYKLKASSFGNGAIISRALYGSDNGSSWTLLDSGSLTFAGAYDEQTFTFVNTHAYRYYKIAVDKSSHGIGTLWLGRIQLYVAVHIDYTGVDVLATNPSDTETVFKNKTGAQNDFVFEVLSSP